VGVINFPNDFPFIRAHSSKTLYQQRVKDDVVVYDYPTRFDRAVVGKSAYPIIFDASEDVQKALVGLISEQRPNVYPAGRAGTFSYLDMDKAIKSGWAAANRLLAEGE
jgi:UDP-galactopyranose mutase